MEPERMRRMLAENHCPYCGSGPWRSVANHIWTSHQIRAAEVKEAAGIPRSRSLICAETKAILGERAVERDSVSNMEGMVVTRKTANVSEAGRSVWRENLKSASQARTKIGPADRESIRVRLAAGEMKKRIAAEFGVSVSRIRQIEQGIEFVPRRVASR